MDTEDLKFKIKAFEETIWDFQIDDNKIESWLSNFKGEKLNIEEERLIALYLLSQFNYFGYKELRELIRIFYRELIQYPIIRNIRNSNSDTKNLPEIRKLVKTKLNKIKIIGIGNPSESGTHLLYYLRQEANLSKKAFLNTHEIFDRYGAKKNLKLQNSEIDTYYFVDDLCGSGTQASDYSDKLVDDIKRLKKDCEVNYLVLFSTKRGLETVQKNTSFDNVRCLFELDESFKCFGISSRYFHRKLGLDKVESKKMAEHYGQKLFRGHPLGYKDSQLLIGFHHNVPDNTLPIFWRDHKDWHPLIKRFHKK